MELTVKYTIPSKEEVVKYFSSAGCDYTMAHNWYDKLCQDNWQFNGEKIKFWDKFASFYIVKYKERERLRKKLNNSVKTNISPLTVSLDEVELNRIASFIQVLFEERSGNTYLGYKNQLKEILTLFMQKNEIEVKDLAERLELIFENESDLSIKNITSVLI